MTEEQALIRFERYANIIIGTVQGEDHLDANNADRFSEVLGTYIGDKPDVHLLLNLHHIQYLSSAILSALIEARGKLTKNGGGIRVCALNEEVRKVFEVTNLDTVFHAVPQVQKAADEYVAYVQQELHS